MTIGEAGTEPGKGTDRTSTVDRLLDRAVQALNHGDVAGAHELAATALSGDAANREAAALLAESAPTGELRRATLLFADLVGSTALSERHEPELYRGVVRRYTSLCRDVIEARYGGHVSHIAGDGLMAVFGVPVPHENDVERAVRAALDIATELSSLSAQVEAAVGERLQARAGVHKGLVYLDVDGDEIYGLAANVAARLHGLAAPGEVVVSETVRGLVSDLVRVEPLPPQQVKGVSEPLTPYRVVGLAAGPSTPRFGGPFVGRRAEQEALLAAWGTVAGGEGGPRGVHLIGEGGIGKSRLCAAVFEAAHPSPAARVDLCGSPFHTEVGLHPLRVLLDHCGRQGVDAGAAPRDLAEVVAAVGLDPAALVPLLAPLSDLATGPYGRSTLDGRKLHEAIAEAALRFLVAALSPGPALLMVEDLHWCDASTIGVVARLLAEGPAGLLVVTSSRLPAPAGLRGTVEVPLGPLPAEDSERLITALVPGISEHERRALVGRGDGVPLFLEELVHARAAAAGVAEPLGPAGAGDEAEPAPPSTGEVPDALYELLISRLHATPGTARVAGAAAALGRRVDLALLGRVADLPPPELDAAVAGLVDAHVLVADGAGLSFRHELLREVAYELAPPSRRRTLHARAAAALTDPELAGGAVDWRMVAGHRRRAGQVAPALDAFQAAADDAQRRGELAEARSLLDRAVELVAGLPEGADRGCREVGLRLRRGFLAVSAEGNNSLDALHDYERCLEIALADPASDEMFGTLIALWGRSVIRGELGRAEQVTEMMQAGLVDHPEYAPENEASWGVVRWYGGDFPAARELLEEAVAGLGARASDRHYEGTWFMPTDAVASAQVFLALARFVGGDDAGADEQIAAALARCREVEFPQGPYTAASVLAYEVFIDVERGDLAAARQAVVGIAELADRHGFDIWAVAAMLQSAAVEGLADLAASAPAEVLAERERTLDGMVATWRMLGIAVFVPFYLAVSARLRAGAGDLAGASTRVAEALEVAATTGMHFYDAELLRLQGLWQVPGAAGGVVDLRPDGPGRAALELARRQGATVFERRSTGDRHRPRPA
jgi:class 3 adenylate cyclase